MKKNIGTDVKVVRILLAIVIVGLYFANMISGTVAIILLILELRERTIENPVHKPIAVNFAGGYRSSAGSSIIKSKLNGTSKVYDLSEAVKQFQK